MDETQEEGSDMKGLSGYFVALLRSQRQLGDETEKRDPRKTNMEGSLDVLFWKSHAQRISDEASEVKFCKSRKDSLAL